MTKVKICGVNSEAAFDAVVEAGADYLGFVFFEPSPRFVSPEYAASLNARHEGGPLRVGLFVKPPLAVIAAALQVVKLDILQIYGSADLCRQIRSESGIKTWRSIGVGSAGDLPGAESLDGFVIEAKAPSGATRPGGNATSMDWALLKGWNAPAPWLLAGGLNASNVASAIAETGAPGVDISSGVETAPGEKSPAMIRDFVAEVRRAGFDNVDPT
jgi:phosphoribosylanthranilate isomerase